MPSDPGGSYSVPVRTARELERMVSAYLLQWVGPDVPAIIDIDLLVEKSEKVQIDYYPALRANHQVEGMIACDLDTGRPFVYIDEALADDDSPDGGARFRMTVAEGLGHLRLHRQLIDEVTSAEKFCELQRHPYWSDIEWEAKRFASLVLMPTKRLIFEAGDVYSQIVRRPEICELFDKSAMAYKHLIVPVQKQICSILARRFAVLNRVMDRRLADWTTEIYKSIERALEGGLDSLP